MNLAATLSPERIWYRSDVETFVRFMRLVQVGENEGDCWLWIGNRPDGRYGHFSLDMKAVGAHRWMYQFIHGSIPAELVVRHKCDVPSCVNPMHLETGTARENTIDKFQRGRGADRRGEKHPLARLTADQVREIRRLASCGQTNRSLAKLYGVNEKHVGRIVRREGWVHI